MADKDTPPIGELAGVGRQYPAIDFDELLRQLREVGARGLARGSGGADGKSVSDEQDALKPAVAGGEDKPKSRRGRRGKVTNVGGHRIVNYYELTKHELEMLGSKRGDAAKSYAVATFCLGLVVDGIKDLLLNPPPAGAHTGVWATLLCVAFVGMIYFAIDGWNRTKSARTFLQEVRDDHDFE